MRVLIKPRQLPLAWASAWLYQAPSSCSLSIISVPSRNKAVNKKVRNNGPGTGKNCENIDSIFGCYISISPISTCILLLLPSDDLSVDQLSMPGSLRRQALVLPPSAGGPPLRCELCRLLLPPSPPPGAHRTPTFSRGLFRGTKPLRAPR